MHFRAGFDDVIVMNIKLSRRTKHAISLIYPSLTTQKLLPPPLTFYWSLLSSVSDQSQFLSIRLVQECAPKTIPLYYRHSTSTSIWVIQSPILINPLLHIFIFSFVYGGCSETGGRHEFNRRSCRGVSEPRVGYCV